MTGIRWWQLGISRAAKRSPMTMLLMMNALLNMTLFVNSMVSVKTFWMASYGRGRRVK